MEQNVLERILDGSMKPTNLPLETLREITDGFSVDRIIGEGGFGTVYKGAIRNGSVAVKRIRSSMTIDDKLFRREVDSLMEVNHQNVVQFLGLCSHTEEMPMKKPESRGYIYAEIRERLLCFEYISNGSLDKNITDELRGLEWDKRYQIIKGICVGLHYLHMEKCILHMDLKPANILLDDQMVPKITDFGLSRPTENSQTMSIDKFSTPGYGAPENLSGRGRMSVKSDMYSLGVIIIEVVTGSKGVPDNNNILRRWRHRWNKSAKETPLEYHQQVTKCIEIGLLCQKIDPCARPSISQVMSKFVEMESTHDNGRNANDLTVGQINFPTYWDDGMLGVEPLELQFGHNKKNQILSCSVELINDTDSFIAFKIQTLSPLPYSIEPNKDIVKPRYKGIVRTGNVAVKRIRSSMTIYDKLFRREVDSLMEVNHQNVVRFVGLCSHTVETPMKNPESRGYIYAEIRERLLCFEYISNGSLDKKITDELRGLEWDSRYQIIKGICAGLRYLHMEKCILHMDLKPANILLNNQMVPKITDFGLSRPTENSQTMSINHFSSPGYSAPENLFGRGRMSVKSDMYSLGVIIIELVTGHKDIPDNYNNIIRRWRHRWRKSAKETPLEFQQQVTKCIEISVLCQNIDPLKRPFISEIMSIFDEMESNNNHSRNANESPVFQINAPTHWEDDMLGVEPLEIRFGYSKQKQILSCSVELSNDTDGFIAFKMQTMSPLPYSIKPNRDIVKPRSKCSVDITLPAANTQDHKAARQYSTNKQYTEEFIVRSIEVNGGLISKDINEDMFDKHTVGHHVDEIHLAVVSEESCSKEVMDSGSKQVKKQYAKPGSVHHLLFFLRGVSMHMLANKLCMASR